MLINTTMLLNLMLREMKKLISKDMNFQILILILLKLEEEIAVMNSLEL